MPDEIIIDDLEEHAFRRSIESMLRHGRADEAADRLRALLPDIAGPGRILPGRLLEITPRDLTLTGWDRIDAKLEEYGRTESPITAIGIGICDPLDLGLVPDEAGHLTPPLETTYYSDATFSFSQTDRQDLLEGYSSFGCEWQGDHDRSDHTLAIEGIDDIYGAIVALENKVAGSDNPSARDIHAGAVGACYLGVLIFQATRDAVIRHGLPRALAVLLVNSDAYPFFDAPVLTCDEYLDDGEVRIVDHARAASSLISPDESDPDEADAYEPEQTGSLIGMGMSGTKDGARKKMALVLEGEEASNPLGMADELVAQAAFNPESFDLSRFMPQAAEPRDTDFADPAGDEPFGELELPIEAIVPEPDAVEPAEQPEAPCQEWHTEAPDATKPEENVHDADERDTLTPPMIAGDVNGPGYGDSVEPSGSEEHPASAPAGHSLRSRIRIAPPEEEAPSALDRLRISFAGLLKRVQDMLLRR